VLAAGALQDDPGRRRDEVGPLLIF
jgi:hypothetical protein